MASLLEEARKLPPSTGNNRCKPWYTLIQPDQKKQIDDLIDAYWRGELQDQFLYRVEVARYIKERVKKTPTVQAIGDYIDRRKPRQPPVATRATGTKKAKGR